MKLLALLLLLTGPGWSQIPDSQKTAGILNGRFWTTMEAFNRTSYVAGYADAWGALDGYKSNPDGLPKNATYGEVVAGLDRFYSAPENLIVPIIEAIQLWTRKAQGEDPETWAKRVATSIRVWHQMVDGK